MCRLVTKEWTGFQQDLLKHAGAGSPGEHYRLSLMEKAGKGLLEYRTLLRGNKAGTRVLEKCSPARRKL